MSVKRCVCFDVTFERVLRIADESGGGLLEAHRQTGCGARCGVCIPYLQLVIKTRRTEFPVMWPDDFRREGICPGVVTRLRSPETHPIAS